MIIVSNKSGQLCNRIIEFSHYIAYCKEFNLKVSNIQFNEYALFFENTAHDKLCRYPKTDNNGIFSTLQFIFFKLLNKFVQILPINKSIFHEFILKDLNEYSFDSQNYFELRSIPHNTSKNKLTFLYGRFFRDYESVSKHQMEIKSFFTPRAELIQKVTKAYSDIYELDVLLIGVHIRKGDYKIFANGKYYYSNSEYLATMRNIQAAFSTKKVKFVIFSNEKISFEKTDGLNITFGPKDIMGDLILMSKLDYIVGPPSTYSLWASFYGDVPIYQLKDINKPISVQDFKKLPIEILFNYTYN